MSASCVLIGLVLGCASVAGAATRGVAQVPLVARLSEGGQEGDEPEPVDCTSRKVRKSTLKLLKETPFLGLFNDLRNQSIFEASGVAVVDSKFYVVFDSSFSLGYLDEYFHFRSPLNKLIGDKGEEDSQFEGIAYVPENNTFLLLQEAVVHEDDYKPHIITAKLKEDLSGWDTVEDCIVDFELTHENKGFESIQYVVNSQGAWLLGLCEGNHCMGGSEGRDPGQGRIVASQLERDAEGECVWRPQRVIKIPRRAHFTDYSAFAFRGSKLAILSQENAALWIGDFDKERLEFLSHGQVFHFPRDNHCETIFCNLEGIQFLDDRRVLAASDKAKRYQPFYCDAKDQMIHIFALPATYDPYAVVDPIDADTAGEL